MKSRLQRLGAVLKNKELLPNGKHSKINADSPFSMHHKCKPHFVFGKGFFLLKYFSKNIWKVILIHAKMIIEVKHCYK